MPTAISRMKREYVWGDDSDATDGGEAGMTEAQSGANSCKRGEREWVATEIEEEYREEGDPRYEVSELYWIAGDSRPGDDAYGAMPVAEVYGADDADLVSAAPDLFDAAKRAWAYLWGADSEAGEGLDEQLRAALRKAEGAV